MIGLRNHYFNEDNLQKKNVKSCSLRKNKKNISMSSAEKFIQNVNS